MVADSVPRLEWKESMNKGRAIFRAAGLAEHGLDEAHGQGVRAGEGIDGGHKERVGTVGQRLVLPRQL